LSVVANIKKRSNRPPLHICGLWTVLTLATVDHGIAQTTRPVDCSAGETVAAALAAANPGDTLTVRGICKETVSIPAESTRITLNGQGVATLAHPTGTTTPGPAAHVVYIRGRGITVTGFRILGGVDGIHLSGPSHAVIHGNFISGNKGRGVHVDKGSVAQIYDNVIERNDGGGIHITESSMARIGFLIPPQPQLEPNQIRSNGSYGIFIERGSSARIVGNRIEANDGAGVRLDRSSEADWRSDAKSAATLRERSGRSAALQGRRRSTEPAWIA
jgi:nitrous oxidase accessory protein NosD